MFFILLTQVQLVRGEIDCRTNGCFVLALVQHERDRLIKNSSQHDNPIRLAVLLQKQLHGVNHMIKN